MTEHEKLKAISDEIGYEYSMCKNNYMSGKSKYNYSDMSGHNCFYLNDYQLRDINVKEIIFYPEFNNKVLDYLERKGSIENKMTYSLGIMNNLYDPVDYLYKLLELGKK